MSHTGHFELWNFNLNFPNFYVYTLNFEILIWTFQFKTRNFKLLCLRFQCLTLGTDRGAAPAEGRWAPAEGR